MNDVLPPAARLQISKNRPPPSQFPRCGLARKSLAPAIYIHSAPRANFLSPHNHNLHLNHNLPAHPGGMTDGSRGLIPRMRETPPENWKTKCTLKGCQEYKLLGFTGNFPFSLRAVLRHWKLGNASQGNDLDTRCTKWAKALSSERFLPDHVYGESQ